MSSYKKFKYIGPIESSKSIVNRALILKAIHPQLNLTYNSQAQDVLDLNECLEKFSDLKDQEFKQKTNSDFNTSFYVGSGGTTFRFLALFLSKYLGTWNIKLSEQLAQRPSEDLVKVLNQLGVEVLFSKGLNSEFETLMTIKSNFWKTNTVSVDFLKSSQFFSAIALAASDSKNEFTILCENRHESSGYEIITLDLLRKIGVQVEDLGHKVKIKNLSSEGHHLSVGADWSSIIYLLSFCFSGSEIEITNIDFESLEPDKKGLDILKSLGLSFEIEKNNGFSRVRCESSDLGRNTLEINLTHNPDLFPQFAVLLSQISLKYQVETKIEYPKQLIYKESNRLDQMKKVLISLGFDVLIKENIFTIKSNSTVEALRFEKSFNFDSKLDHRLIMSFELLKSFGYNIKYNDKDEVKKSFANFFEIING